jgi:hypothetical protein
MLANISTKNPYPVDRKYRRFIHDLGYAYMNILVDSEFHYGKLHADLPELACNKLKELV